MNPGKGCRANVGIYKAIQLYYAHVPLEPPNHQEAGQGRQGGQGFGAIHLCLIEPPKVALVSREATG